MEIQKSLEGIRSRARERAREGLQDGAVTSAYKADRREVINVLNQVLASEIVCSLRYKNHYFRAQGLAAENVVDEFAEHAAQEAEHADRVARRIVQLGGDPDMNPASVAERAHCEYRSPSSLFDMINENLIAERIAIESYAEIVRWLGNDDPTTRRMMEDILAEEEEHADELAGLIGTKQ